MSHCDCTAEAQSHHTPQRILRIALGLNATMFVIGMGFGLIAHSSGLIADALDMLSDALTYALALYALTSTPRIKARLATISGWVLIALGIGVLCDVIRRGLYGEEPHGSLMIVIALISLCVNLAVLTLLKKHKGFSVNLWASWVFTRADVVANLGVIGAGFPTLLSVQRLASMCCMKP